MLYINLCLFKEIHYPKMVNQNSSFITMLYNTVSTNYKDDAKKEMM